MVTTTFDWKYVPIVRETYEGKSPSGIYLNIGLLKVDPVAILLKCLLWRCAIDRYDYNLLINSMWKKRCFEILDVFKHIVAYMIEFVKEL